MLEKTYWMIDLYVARGVSDDSNKEVWRNEGK